jgi:CrcB protein
MLTTWFLWALTTYSTFALESFFMIDRWNYIHFILNISLNLIWTIVFAWFGFYLISYLLKR